MERDELARILRIRQCQLLGGKMKGKQTGFTLIEIAIVLVIVGLLLGGILKGQELINSTKVKNLATDFKNIPVYIYGYQDKFRALPGDDAAATTHVTGGTGTANGDGNGVIAGAWDTTTNADESCQFWQHVRLAGLAPGTTTVDCASGTAGSFVPKNSEGGRLGIQSVSGFTTITRNTAGVASLMTGAYVVCSAGILGKFVKQLDTTLDDANTDTGSVRVADPVTATQSMATTSISDSTPYTVCMSF